MEPTTVFVDVQTMNEFKNLIAEVSHRQQEYTVCYDSLCSAVASNSDHVGELLAQSDVLLGSLRLVKYELADFVSRNADNILFMF